MKYLINVKNYLKEYFYMFYNCPAINVGNYYYCSWAIKIILHGGKFKLFKAIHHKMYINTWQVGI